MKKNNFGGKFIVIDGPNGVGKSTIILELEKKVCDAGYENVIFSKEPTTSCLGMFIRKIAEKSEPRTLACLVAANRYEHLEKKIIPALKEGKTVMVDRFLLSTLVLQQMDGLEKEFLLNLNEKILYPDLQIVILAKEDNIKKRLKERELSKTRFDKPEEEIKLFLQEASYLEGLKIKTMTFYNNEEQDKEKIVNLLYKEVVR